MLSAKTKQLALSFWTWICCALYAMSINVKCFALDKFCYNINNIIFVKLYVQLIKQLAGLSRQKITANDVYQRKNN